MQFSIQKIVKKIPSVYPMKQFEKRRQKKFRNPFFLENFMKSFKNFHSAERQIHTVRILPKKIATQPM